MEFQHKYLLNTSYPNYSIMELLFIYLFERKYRAGRTAESFSSEKGAHQKLKITHDMTRWPAPGSPATCWAMPSDCGRCAVPVLSSLVLCRFSTRHVVAARSVLFPVRFQLARFLVSTKPEKVIRFSITTPERPLPPDCERRAWSTPSWRR